MACQGGVIRVWTGEEWEKMACQGCENCLMDEDMPTKSLVDRYARQAALYAEGIKPTLYAEHVGYNVQQGKAMQATADTRAETSTHIHEQLERHITPDDTSETPTDAPGTPEIPPEVIDQGAQAMTEWVIKQTALAKKAVDVIQKTMDTPRPVPNRKDRRNRQRQVQRYLNQQKGRQ